MTPTRRELSTRAADCLKLIYKLRERGERATTSQIRERLQALEASGQLSDASVTQLFKSLAEQGLVEHTPYRGAALTAEGEQIAAELIRHHRLLELYLVKELGYRWDEVDEEAERLEHAISEHFEDRLDALLGHPTADPHGDPIPDRAGAVQAPPTRPLSELGERQAAVVRRVSDDDPARLRYLARLDLVPGTAVHVLERAPFGGLMQVLVGADATAQVRTIGLELAATVQVELAGADH
ncbi:MAG TPA: metal-dependent transcriptional regulator [Ktedonobacterales bacterium]|jgi:DtxR family Mn-dependent transcriptional regulator